MVSTKLWTAEEIAELPDDDFRYALVREELSRMPPTKPRHGRVVHTVGRFIGNHVADQELGTVYDQSGFLFERGPDTVLGPDPSFVQAAHVPADDNVYPLLAPELVVEIISPSQIGPSIEEKVAIYLAAGVRLVSAFDPARRTVHVHRADGTELLLSAEDTIDGEALLPGFRLPVAHIFAQT